MRNNTDDCLTLARAKKEEPEIFYYLRLGFMDRFLGSGFREEYETWCPGRQENYEHGRHLAGECMFTGQVKNFREAKAAWREWIKFPRSLEFPFYQYLNEILPKDD